MRTASKTVVLTQKCRVSTHQGDRELSWGIGIPGEQIKLLHGGGFQTRVRPLQFIDDEANELMGLADNATKARLAAHREHMASCGHTESPYGPCY